MGKYSKTLQEQFSRRTREDSSVYKEIACKGTQFYPGKVREALSSLRVVDPRPATLGVHRGSVEGEKLARRVSSLCHDVEPIIPNRYRTPCTAIRLASQSATGRQNGQLLQGRVANGRLGGAFTRTLWTNHPSRTGERSLIHSADTGLCNQNMVRGT